MYEYIIMKTLRGSIPSSLLNYMTKSEGASLLGGMK